MTEPDRLAKIKDLLAVPRPPGSATDPITGRLTRGDLRWMVGEVERLRGLLARLEWSGDILRGDEVCPVCGYTPDDGHAGLCEWVAVMRP